MEFDKSRIYTSVNAEDIKIGSRVVVADNLETLKQRLEEEDFVTLLNIRGEEYSTRFVVPKYCPTALCYLVSEPEEKKLKWTDLKLGDKVRNKVCPTVSFLITGYDSDPSKERHVYIRGAWRSNEELAEWEKVEE